MQKPKRRTVEIYFVLYLAALIFLLPDKNDIFYNHKNSNSKNFELPFVVQAEKPSLTCRWKMNESTPEIYDVDSINTIFYKGNVKNVKFEFLIEGSIRNQKTLLSSSSNSSNNFFRFIENSSANTALFVWTPQLDEKINKNYLVHVIATGTPTKGEAAGKQITVKTSFSLNMTYIGASENSYLAAASITDTMMNNSTDIKLSSNFSPEINLWPSQQRINALSKGKWTNTIIVTGFNPKELAKAPELSVKDNESRGGSARIMAINQDNIIIEGTAPSSGNMKVQVSVRRAYDNKEVKTEFFVTPNEIQEPVFADVMYPNKSYEIIPRLPILSGQTRAILKENDRERASDDRGGIIKFTPSIHDTGKIFILERYVDKELVGQKYKIEVKNYPDPRILNIKNDNNKIYVYTISFGFHLKDENFVKYLEIEGNATASERYGGSNESLPRGEWWKQTFVVTQKDYSKPFIFSIRAVDSRGKKSDLVNYPS